MTTQDIKKILAEDIEYKKPFEAKYPAVCDFCLNETDIFIFIGDKKKMCRDCQAEVTEYLEQ